MDKLVAMIREIGLTFAYHHFAEGDSPTPPFLIYLLPQSHHFGADGKVYYKIEEVRLEVYTDYKSVELEQKVETVLEKHGIFYAKSEVWIESEKLYEVVYTFEMEVKNNGK